MTNHAGRVYLVGAGPGDPGMLTLRGAACLKLADVVLYDYLVNPRILSHCKSDASKVSLGSHAEGKVWSQQEINDALVKYARQGKSVVRLKGGDPAIFARTAEELATLEEHQITFEIVPGITTALAAGSCVGIPITHRKLASAVAIVTGHECREKPDTMLDFRQLARFPGTLVIYMGTTTVRTWTSALLEQGKPASTPVTAIRHCSLPDQTQFSCTLGELADRVDFPNKLRPPVIFIIGDVAEPARFKSWFQNRPLFGQRVCVTRPIEQARTTAENLEALGAQVSTVPMIEVRPLPEKSHLDKLISQVARFDWLVFASANGVRFFMERLLETGRDVRHLSGLQVASIGTATTEKLRQFSICPDCQATRFDSEGLLAAMGPRLKKASRILLVRASRGRDSMRIQLENAGHQVEQHASYENLDSKNLDPVFASNLAAGQVDWIMVTSSAIARALVSQFGESLHRTNLASISPITSATLRELNFEPTVEASSATIASLTDAISEAVANLNNR